MASNVMNVRVMDFESVKSFIKETKAKIEKTKAENKELKAKCRRLQKALAKGAK